MSEKKILIIFGGQSAEHEVSAITGLQVIEKIDWEKYEPFAIRLTPEGIFHYYPYLVHRSDYLKIKPNAVSLSKDDKGTYFCTSGLFKNKIYFDAAFLACHGGSGESGQLQGFFEILNVPYTSPTTEASSTAMNKALTKEVLEAHRINTVEWTRVFSDEVKMDVTGTANSILNSIKLPVIIKPVHLGSSIAIKIAKTKVELKKYLLEASHIDTEILIEKLLSDFTEYNVAVRKIEGKIEVSQIEKPLSKDEILSFADKYQRGGKKTGGMASLNRELPAKISEGRKKTLQKLGSEIFRLLRLKGMVRIDFMVTSKAVYVTEVNPIPGSMAFYLWEASGIPFKTQITDLIEQSMKDHQTKSAMNLTYATDIVEKFVKS